MLTNKRGGKMSRLIVGLVIVLMAIGLCVLPVMADEIEGLAPAEVEVEIGDRTTGATLWVESGYGICLNFSNTEVMIKRIINDVLAGIGIGSLASGEPARVELLVGYRFEEWGINVRPLYNLRISAFYRIKL